MQEIEEDNRMRKTIDIFKKIRDTKGIFHAKMSSIKDTNCIDLTEAEDIKKWQEYTELLKKGLNDCWEAQCKTALKEKILGKMVRGQKYPGIVH